MAIDYGSFSWPNSEVGSNPSVGVNGSPIPPDSTLVGGENPSGNLEPLQTDASGNLLVNVNAGAITVLNPSVSPTGAAVPADATFVGVQNGANLVGLTEGQATMANSLPVVIASNQSAVPVSIAAIPAPVNSNGSFAGASISVATTISAPANAVGFLLEWDSANTDFGRWCDSNTTASATVGMKLEAGRDTGYLPMSHNLSICPNSGTQAYTIQWVLSS